MTSLQEYLDLLMDYLMGNQSDTGTYLLVFFLLCVAAAVFLPIPIEIGLIWNPSLFFPVKALVMGLGKGTGAVAVFYIGAELDKLARFLSGRRLGRWWLYKAFPFLNRCELAAKRSERGATVARAVCSVTAALKLVERKFARPPSRAERGWLSRKSEGFVRKYGVIAMYVIMSIPGMVDTLPLYLFSILNEKGTLISLRDFTLANFLAGINRAFLIFAILELLGVRLFAL
jgi:hypothetical protein